MKQIAALGDNRIIPTVIANTTRGMPNEKVQVFHGKEIIGYISVSNNTQAGLIAEILLNPLLVGATRLKNFVQNYQQYRFDKLKATVRGNLPTTVGGDLYLAYTRNPDHKIVDNAEAPANVFAVEKSIITNLWSATEFDCECSTNQWYNVDADSEELMVTTHGKLFIATLGSFNLTTQFEMPLFLEYTVSCKGQQVQGSANASAIIFPATYYGAFAGSDSNGSTQMFLQDSETLSYPWNQGMVALQPYTCEPEQSLVLDIEGGVPQTVTAGVVVWDGNTSGWFRWYMDLAAFEAGEVYKVKPVIPTKMYLGRFIISPATDALATVTQTSFRFSDGRRLVKKVPVNSKAVMSVPHHCQSCTSMDLTTYIFP